MLRDGAARCWLEKSRASDLVRLSLFLSLYSLLLLSNNQVSTCTPSETECRERDRLFYFQGWLGAGEYEISYRESAHTGHSLSAECLYACIETSGEADASAMQRKWKGSDGEDSPEAGSLKPNRGDGGVRKSCDPCGRRHLRCDRGRPCG